MRKVLILVIALILLPALMGASLKGCKAGEGGPAPDGRSPEFVLKFTVTTTGNGCVLSWGIADKRNRERVGGENVPCGGRHWSKRVRASYDDSLAELVAYTEPDAAISCKITVDAGKVIAEDSGIGKADCSVRLNRNNV